MTGATCFSDSTVTSMSRLMRHVSQEQTRQGTRGRPGKVGTGAHDELVVEKLCLKLWHFRSDLTIVVSPFISLSRRSPKRSRLRCGFGHLVPARGLNDTRKLIALFITRRLDSGGARCRSIRAIIMKAKPRDAFADIRHVGLGQRLDGSQEMEMVKEGDDEWKV